MSPAATPSSYSITVRLHTSPDHAVVGQVATKIAEQGGIVTAIDVADSRHDRLVVDVTCSGFDSAHSDELVAAVEDPLQQVVTEARLPHGDGPSAGDVAPDSEDAADAEHRAAAVARVDEQVDLDVVRAHVLELDHVRQVHDLHASMIGTGLPVISAHVVIDDGCFESGHAPRILEEIRQCLREHFPVSFDHATIQLETAGLRERTCDSMEHQAH